MPTNEVRAESRPRLRSCEAVCPDHRAAAGGGAAAVARRLLGAAMTMATTTMPDPMLPRPYLVSEVAKETPDTFTLTLAPGSGSHEDLFHPGQFSMLWVFGV